MRPTPVPLQIILLIIILIKIFLSDICRLAYQCLPSFSRSWFTCTSELLQGQNGNFQLNQSIFLGFFFSFLYFVPMVTGRKEVRFLPILFD